MSVVTEENDLQFFLFFLVSSADFGIRGMLTSWNELERVHSSSVFCKSL